ncbi:MAG: pantoate--beta-alanine ligase [Bacteroidota bacterium]
MIILKNIKKIKNYIKKKKNVNKTIGFVPTMGALHQGHISLLERAKHENDIVVCSLFVNPTQFNDKSDFEKYPRTFKEDIEKLKLTGCDVVFAPNEAEMYPKSENSAYNIGIDLGYLDKIMEGNYRPGHFKGVVIIVNKLFDITEPDTAYFGEKDYQQLIILKYFVNMLKLPVKIIGCPIIREDDGLAMSSRNKLLSVEERKNASIIYQTLLGVKEKVKTLSPMGYTFTINEIKAWVKQKINNNSFLRLEYIEIVDSKTLLPIEKGEEASEIVACIAVFAGKVRLIDNIVL